MIREFASRQLFFGHRDNSQIGRSFFLSSSFAFFSLSFFMSAMRVCMSPLTHSLSFHVCHAGMHVSRLRVVKDGAVLFLACVDAALSSRAESLCTLRSEKARERERGEREERELKKRKKNSVEKETNRNETLISNLPPCLPCLLFYLLFYLCAVVWSLIFSSSFFLLFSVVPR